MDYLRFFGTAVALIGMLTIRFVYRIYRFRVAGEQGKGRRQVAIIGSGTAGVSLVYELKHNMNGSYVPYCMLDDAPTRSVRSSMVFRYGVPSTIYAPFCRILL